jgi:hypothetical protein
MRIDKDGRVVIDDDYICGFMRNNGSESFFVMCEAILREICIACEQKLSVTNDHDLLSKRFEVFKGELIDALSSRKVDMSDVMKGLSAMNENNMLRINSKLEHIPAMNGKLDEMKVKYDVTKVIENSVSKNSDSIVQTLGVIKSSQEQIANKIETFTAARNTTRFKGEEGERGLMNVLESKLHMRDGYVIEDVKSIPHSCDIVIKRNGYPDVRIESKAHGRDNGENVRWNQVKKFESDLLTLNNHGIFVSLYSGICGKGSFEIELLPNNKFAVYLSNNNYDGDMITEVIQLIYRLDKFVSNESEEFKVSTESMIRIRTYITDFNRKIDELKTTLKHSIRILNDITLDLIEKTLMGNDETCVSKTSQDTQHQEYICNKCNQKCTSKAGLTLHKKKCET